MVKAFKQVTKKSGRHYESPDGDKYPSVTTILNAINKPALINWSAKVERELVIDVAATLYIEAPNGNTPKMSRPTYVTTLKNRIGKGKAHQKVLERAGNIGKEAHKRIEWATRKMMGQKVGLEPVISQEALWAYMVWEDWTKTVNFKPILCEQMVYSKRYGYAGTMDLLAEIDIDGKTHKILADYKTSKGIYAESSLQNTAYVHALIEMGHAEPPLDGMVIRLPKVATDDKPEMKFIAWEEQEVLFDAFLHTFELWKWLRGNEVKKLNKILEIK